MWRHTERILNKYMYKNKKNSLPFHSLAPTNPDEKKKVTTAFLKNIYFLININVKLTNKLHLYGGGGVSPSNCKILVKASDQFSSFFYYLKENNWIISKSSEHKNRDNKPKKKWKEKPLGKKKLNKTWEREGRGERKKNNYGVQCDSN